MCNYVGPARDKCVFGTLLGLRNSSGEAPNALSAAAGQATLESVDHWPMATLTQDALGGKPALVAASVEA